MVDALDDVAGQKTVRPLFGKREVITSRPKLYVDETDGVREQSKVRYIASALMAGESLVPFLLESKM
jgi:hypothetical protein